MAKYLRMLIINPNQEISIKSSGAKRNKIKQQTGFSRANSAIGGKLAFSSKMLIV